MHTTVFRNALWIIGRVQSHSCVFWHVALYSIELCRVPLHFVLVLVILMSCTQTAAAEEAKELVGLLFLLCVYIRLSSEPSLTSNF